MSTIKIPKHQNLRTILILMIKVVASRKKYLILLSEIAILLIMISLKRKNIMFHKKLLGVKNISILIQLDLEELNINKINYNIVVF